MGAHIIVNDIHLADRPPASCTEGYTDDLFELLAHVGKLAEDRNADSIILAGDVFHLKTPSRTSHRLVMRFIDAIRAWHRPVLIVPGNHDMRFDRLDSIDDTQPLGVVFASGAAHLLHGWSACDAGLITDPVYGAPWLMTFDDDTVFDMLEHWRTRVDAGTPGLVVAHAPLYPAGLELPFQHYKAANWAAAMGNHGTVHYGHVHEAHGRYQQDSVTFSNPGALSRGSLHEHNLTRPVAVASWHPDTGIEHIVLAHKPATAVFELARAEATRTGQVNLEQFIAQIGKTRLETVRVESVLEHIRQLGVSTALYTLVEELLREGAT